MYTLKYINEGKETEIPNLKNLSDKYNIIISSFIVPKIIINVTLDLCSDLIYSKPELLDKSEFDVLLKLFDDIILANSTNTFIIKELTNKQLQNLIKKFELSNESSEEFKQFYNRLLLAIYLFLNYKKENIKIGQLIEQTLYKGDEYYKEAYETNETTYRLYNTIIIPDIIGLSIHDSEEKYIQGLIKKIIDNGTAFTQKEIDNIKIEIIGFDQDTQDFILYIIKPSE
jgi:hypothetical protein